MNILINSELLGSCFYLPSGTQFTVLNNLSQPPCFLSTLWEVRYYYAVITLRYSKAEISCDFLHGKVSLWQGKHVFGSVG